MPATQAPAIHYATDAARLYLAFGGHATHVASQAADSLAQEFLTERRETPEALEVVLDLCGCEFLDSTFAGWMIRLQRQVRPTGGRVLLSRCPDSCRHSLEVMGLVSLFELAAVPPPAETKVLAYSMPADARADTLEFALRAHEDLAELNLENRRAFAPIATALRRERDRQR